MISFVFQILYKSEEAKNPNSNNNNSSNGYAKFSVIEQGKETI